ncbi:hypothetical protein [uncultured Roseobacter sp.]|uniref:hypothetical protein n=1 Tax=uncultured Roseobacter sp. TaxID=114847 RepID=UPI0026314811|nr:hypothetical protein [uncultured Roseobacter sp.]
MRSGNLRKFGAFAGLFVLLACSALPQKDLQVEYFEAVRELGLTPVYPPREELQVGDVFFVSTNPSAPNDATQTVQVWMGTVQAMRKEANDYLKSRINFTNTDTTSNNGSFDLKPSQADFSSGVVTLNNGARTTLPLVTFPTITGSASSGGALGSFGFLSSFGLSFGRNESVNIDFKDTRAFGVPLGAVRSFSAVQKEYVANICPHAQNAVALAEGIAAGRPDIPEDMCDPTRRCQFQIVTRTIQTRQIDYRYSSAQIARLAASRLNGVPAGDTPETTLPVPGNVDLNITLGEDASSSSLESLVRALETSANADGAANETDGVSFVGLQGNALKFERVLQKPVAIAYESVNHNLDGDSMSCNLKIVHDG